MFYSDVILSKKGPLAKVWLAAHERKLTKAQLLQTSITRSTQAIVEQDEAPLALRLSGQLLLGVVRIYSRKARYLLDDCNEALMKIKLAFRPGNVDLPTAQTVTSHALLTLPDTLTELDLLLPPDPTILSQTLSSGRDTTLLSNAFDLSVEYPRGLRDGDEEDPLSQFPLGDEEVLDFALDDGRSFSVERGRDAMSVGLEDEFGSIRGLEGEEELDFGFGKGDTGGRFGDEDDGLGGGFGDMGLDFGFGDEPPMGEDHANNGIPPKMQGVDLDFADALLRPQENEESTPPPVTAKLIRKRKLLTADSEIEISKKEYSSHLKDTSNILKKQRFLPRHASLMTLLEARMHGRLAETIFFPPSIHPDLRAMLNPEYLRRFGPDAKRKRADDTTPTPKKARIAEPTALEEEGFGDGGFGDGGFGESGFGFGDEGGFADHPPSPPRQRTISPSLIDEDAQPEDEEAPTSVTGSMSHSTVAAAQLLQKELGGNTTSTLSALTAKAVPQGVRREDAVKMFFEVLVLASRDVIRVKQAKGFGEIRVQGKDGLFKVGQQQILV